MQIHASLFGVGAPEALVIGRAAADIARHVV
jgi:hypothetical protein